MGFERILNNYSVFILGFVTAIVLTIGIPFVESAIPPTPALKVINVQTSPWYISDTNVNATTFSDVFYFVSDGSITFNVTNGVP